MQNENKQHELNLNRITVFENVQYPETFDEYRQETVALLQAKNLFLSEDDLLEGYYTLGLPKAKEGQNKLSLILETNPHILKTGKYDQTKDGERAFMYLDLALDYIVEPSDLFYDGFFVRQLRQTNIFQVPEFLNFHAQNHYATNLAGFITFVRICIRKYKDKLLKPEVIETINEWLQQKEKQSEQDLKGLAEIDKPKKGRLKRSPGDLLTDLTQEQTVLLIYYLQRERIILKDEYLTDLDAGKAFELLTGYSQHTMRQSLGKFNKYQTELNFKELLKVLSRLKKTIENDAAEQN